MGLIGSTVEFLLGSWTEKELISDEELQVQY